MFLSSPARRNARLSVSLALLTLAGVGAVAIRATKAQDARPRTASLTSSRRADISGKLTTPMAVEWKFTGAYFPNNPAALVVSEDTGYLATGNRVFAISLKTGAQKWRFPTDGFLPTTVQVTPTLDKGTLYVGTGEGLYALDAETGKPKWPRYALRNTGVSTSPQVEGDTVYFSTDNGRFYALNANTGEALRGIWSEKNREGIEIGSDISTDFVLSNGMMYYITSDDVLHALSLSSKTQRWASRLDGESMPPVLSGESIYLAAGNTLSAWRASTGQRRWVRPLPAATTAPPVVDQNGNAYVVTSDRYIYALDQQGRGLWKQAPRVDYEVFAQPLVVGDNLIVATAGGGVFAFDTTSGQLKWNYVIHPSATDPNYIPTIINVMTRPAVVGDTLYVATDDGTVTAFRGAAGDLTPPIVTVVEPEAGDYLNGRPPFRVRAKIVDDGSGLNLSTLRVELDGNAIPRRMQATDLSDKPGFFYNTDDDTLEYTTVESEAGKSNALSDGHHTISISVKDWKGNTATKSWSFYTDDTIPRRRRDPNQPGNRGPGGNSGRGGDDRGGGGN